MGLKAVLYIGLLGLGVGCSNSDPRLQGERELLDGTVFVETEARFLAENLPDLRLPRPQPMPAWTPSRRQRAAHRRTCRAALRVDIELVAPDWCGRWQKTSNFRRARRAGCGQALHA